MEVFEEFIVESDLIDFPLHGRKLNWSRPGGVAMSHLDRFLTTEEWIKPWPTCTQWGLHKELCDHSSIMLYELKQKWDPKLFRMLTCWKNIDGYLNFVREQWNNLEVEG